VFHERVRHFAVPQVSLGWVEEELVVLGPTDDGALVAGDVVVAIDGVPVPEAFRAAAASISASTPQHLRFKSLRTLGGGEPGTTVPLEVRGRDGGTRTVTVARGASAPPEPRPGEIEELEDGIYYLDLGRIEKADFDADVVSELASARGIVFDLRGYPKIWTEPLAHLIDEPIECAQWLVPVVALPDRKATTFEQSSWFVEPVKPRFTGKIVFLTDGRAVSAAETYMNLVAFHRLAPIVGEATAGTNGNVNPFVLPGGYYVSWTGMKVLAQDGARHHGVGVQPTVPCARTLAGIAAGRDEQLEKALELVR
jgi:C-terminal processing protease CtpA/Prc